MPDDGSERATLSIGAVSSATGIPAATLRTWERRYGFPDPERTESGHRRYAPAVIGRLRLIERALDSGCRPSDVVGLHRSELERIVDSSAPESESDGGEPSRAEPSSEEAPGGWVDEAMDAVANLDGSKLTSMLRSAWNEEGGVEVLDQYIAPLLVRIGAAWRDGNLEIVHEHHVSEHLQDFLSSRWRPLSERASGPTAVCATVPGEGHVLGLHIAAVVLAMADWQVVFLGARTPANEIAEAAEMHDAAAVVISFSSNYDGERALRPIDAVRRAAGDRTLVVGGRGAPESDLLPKGVRNFESLQEFYSWAFDEGSPDAG